MLEKILKNIGVSENAQKVYTHLLKYGSMSARLLAQKTGMPRPTTYDALNVLTNSGLVFSREEDGKSIFSVTDPNSLELLMDQKIEHLQKSKSEIEGLILKLREQSRTEEPQIRFFAGKEGVKKILNDILWYKNIETYTLWPLSEMIDLLGEEYLEWLNKRRVERKISLKSVRAPGDKAIAKRLPYLADDKARLREIRFTPKGFVFNMSYWIYADKVTFISTGTHSFGFIVHNREFAAMQKAHFDLLWEKATKK